MSDKEEKFYRWLEGLKLRQATLLNILWTRYIIFWTLSTYILFTLFMSRDKIEEISSAIGSLDFTCSIILLFSSTTLAYLLHLKDVQIGWKFDMVEDGIVLGKNIIGPKICPIPYGNTFLLSNLFGIYMLVLTVCGIILVSIYRSDGAGFYSFFKMKNIFILIIFISTISCAIYSLIIDINRTIRGDSRDQKIR